MRLWLSLRTIHLDTPCTFSNWWRVSSHRIRVALTRWRKTSGSSHGAYYSFHRLPLLLPPPPFSDLERGPSSSPKAPFAPTSPSPHTGIIRRRRRTTMGERRRARLRECLLRFGNHDSATAEDGDRALALAAPEPAPKRARRDPEEERGSERAFLEITKAINENAAERRKYLEDGKGGPLYCIVRGRTSRASTGVHDLIMHAYTSQNSELFLEHLGLHKALCLLMEWDYMLTPETSRHTSPYLLMLMLQIGKI